MVLLPERRVQWERHPAISTQPSGVLLPRWSIVAEKEPTRYALANAELHAGARFAADEQHDADEGSLQS